MLLRIKRQHRISDTEVLSRADMMSIATLLLKAQLRWVGPSDQDACYTSEEWEVSTRWANEMICRHPEGIP